MYRSTARDPTLHTPGRARGVEVQSDAACLGVAQDTRLAAARYGKRRRGLGPIPEPAGEQDNCDWLLPGFAS
jgi:hypothetical protein